MTPTLHDEMARATANARIDADALVTAARRRGLAIRRRRQALATIGTLGVAGAAAALVVGLGPGSGPDRVASPTGRVQVLPGGFSPTPTAPFTGRATAAALLYTTEQQSPGGRSTHFRWQDPGDYQGETYAVFRFTPAGSDTPGEVGINVQPGMADDVGNDCSQRFMRHCAMKTLPDGSRLRTYDDLTGKDPAGIRRVAELLRPDGVRVIVSASNGLDVTENDEQIDRAAPVLDTRQLSAIVEASWWGAQLPTYFERVGEELTGEGIPSSVVADDSSLPSPDPKP